MVTTKLANNVSITSATNPATSPIVSMGDANAISIQATVLSVVAGGSSVNITLQGSDDMENWLSTGITGTTPLVVANVVGTVVSQQYTTFGFAYARILYSFVGAVATVVLSVDVNTYNN